MCFTETDICFMLCSYLHRILFSINGVFRARTSVCSPVKMKLNGFIRVLQISFWYCRCDGYIHLNWDWEDRHYIVMLFFIFSFCLCSYRSDRCSWRCCRTRSGSRWIWKVSDAHPVWFSSSLCWWETVWRFHIQRWLHSSALALEETWRCHAVMEDGCALRCWDLEMFDLPLQCPEQLTCVW